MRVSYISLHNGIVRRLTCRSQDTVPHSTGGVQPRPPSPSPSISTPLYPLLRFHTVVSLFPLQIWFHSLTRYDQPNPSLQNCIPPPFPLPTIRSPILKPPLTRTAWVGTSSLRQGARSCLWPTLPQHTTRHPKNVSSYLIHHPARVFTLCDTVWHQRPQLGPLDLNVPPFEPVTATGPTPLSTLYTYPVSQGAAPPEPPFPIPVKSSSGPERTRRPAKTARKHNPVKSVGRTDPKEGGDQESWDSALVRFQTKADKLLGIQHGRPSGGFGPATALAKINTIVKDDLKRSVSGFLYCVLIHRFTNASTRQQPLQRAPTRSRDTEDYMKGLLLVLRPTPVPQRGSEVGGLTVAFLQRRKHFFPSPQSDLTN